MSSVSADEAEYLPADLLQIAIPEILGCVEAFYGFSPVRLVVPVMPVRFYFRLPMVSVPLNLVSLRLFAFELYHPYLALVVVDPSLRMGHDLVVAASVRLFDGVVGVQARLAVSAKLEALQDLAIGQEDRNVPLTGERIAAIAAPNHHAAAGLPGPLLRRGKVEWNVHAAEESRPQSTKRRGVEVSGYAAIKVTIAPRRDALPRSTPKEVGDAGAEYPPAL